MEVELPVAKVWREEMKAAVAELIVPSRPFALLTTLRGMLNCAEILKEFFFNVSTFKPDTRPRRGFTQPSEAWRLEL